MEFFVNEKSLRRGFILEALSKYLSAEYLDKKSPEEAIARHVEFYYLAPLLARSIFSKTASHLKNRQEPGLANKIINKTRQLITQNGLNSLS